METPSHRKRLPVVGDLNEAMRHLSTRDPAEDTAVGLLAAGGGGEQGDPVCDLGLTSTRKRLEGLLHDVTDAAQEPRQGSRKRIDLSPGVWVPSTKKPAHMRAAGRAGAAVGFAGSKGAMHRPEHLTPESVLGCSKLFDSISPEPMSDSGEPGR